MGDGGGSSDQPDEYWGAEVEATRLDLGQLAAECCIILGVTPEQIRKLSPAQCELIYKTSQRREAEVTLRILDAIRAGIAEGDEGQAQYVDKRERLLGIIRGEPDA